MDILAVVVATCVVLARAIVKDGHLL